VQAERGDAGEVRAAGIVTYDRRIVAAAESLGIRTVSP